MAWLASVGVACGSGASGPPPGSGGTSAATGGSSGGSDPITSHGHRKADAQRIRDLIENYQAQTRS